MKKSLPAERILYYADSAYCPYGDRSEDFIRNRTLTIAGDLEARGAKAIVIACNTACAAGLDDVRRITQIPVIGLEPAVKPAVALSRTKRVAVLATPRTIASERLAGLVDRYANGCEVELIAAPDWVGLVERADASSVEARRSVEAIVNPAVERGADVLVLGCTHYPFLSELIRATAGPNVAIVDSREAVARRTRQVLEEAAALNAVSATGPDFTLLTSLADSSTVSRRAGQMLGMPLN